MENTELISVLQWKCFVLENAASVGPAPWMIAYQPDCCGHCENQFFEYRLMNFQHVSSANSLDHPFLQELKELSYKHKIIHEFLRDLFKWLNKYMP
jgi:hypothetical protein